MAIPSRSQGAGTYFTTSATWNRRRLFQVEKNAALLLETLQKYRRDGYYRLHAFVVMPDHFHLLVTTETAAIERIMGLIKGGFSHSMASRTPVWQRGFTDHRIRDAHDFQIRLEYIHQNPVRARMVERAEMYPYSSAYRRREEKTYPSG
jgi:putative transposase